MVLLAGIPGERAVLWGQAGSLAGLHSHLWSKDATAEPLFSGRVTGRASWSDMGSPSALQLRLQRLGSTSGRAVAVLCCWARLLAILPSWVGLMLYCMTGQGMRLCFTTEWDHCLGSLLAWDGRLCSAASTAIRVASMPGSAIDRSWLQGSTVRWALEPPTVTVRASRWAGQEIRLHTGVGLLTCFSFWVGGRMCFITSQGLSPGFLVTWAWRLYSAMS